MKQKIKHKQKYKPSDKDINKKECQTKQNYH